MTGARSGPAARRPGQLVWGPLGGHSECTIMNDMLVGARHARLTEEAYRA